MTATDAQMQAFADQRIRPFAEKLRELIALAADHKSAIDEVYARGVSNDRWEDARQDGPPKLLISGDSANPDDALNFNAAISHLIWLFNDTGAGDVPTSGGTAAQFAAAVRAQWAVLVDSCVRPIGS